MDLKKHMFNDIILNIFFSMNKSQILEDRLKKLSKNGQISCEMLRKIAEETGISYKFAGKAANQLKIKIKNCDLGCF